MSLIEKVYPAPSMLEGAGFEVRRPFPTPHLENVGPFILFDHMGPKTLGPRQAVGAPTHPHAGLETITLIFEGGGRHMDSLGNQSVTGPGDVQWMRAGKGIVHDEGPTEEVLEKGGRSHAVQLWLDMPGDKKFDNPDYRHILSSEIPNVSIEGAVINLVAGHLGDYKGPLETHSNPFMVSANLEAGARVVFDLDQNNEYGLYVCTGAAWVGSPDKTLMEGELALLKAQLSTFEVGATDGDAHIMVIGGPPIRQQLVRYGPFVANSQSHLMDMVKDYQLGKFGSMPTAGGEAD